MNFFAVATLKIQKFIPIVNSFFYIYCSHNDFSKIYLKIFKHCPHKICYLFYAFTFLVILCKVYPCRNLDNKWFPPITTHHDSDPSPLSHLLVSSSFLNCFQNLKKQFKPSLGTSKTMKIIRKEQ